jgi:signal transduction histidine kinase/CheY-like chemotaxis protein
MFNNILDNIKIGIFVLDKDLNCLYINEFMTYFGVHKETFNLKEYETLIHPDDYQREKENCTKFYTKCENCESISRIRINYIYRWIKIKRIVSQNVFIHTLEDIDEFKNMEFDLRNEKIKSDIAYNHKSLFLANVSHELITPINGIIGMITLLEDTDLKNDQRDYIEMLKECSVNLMSIINDILDFSKLEAGKITLDVQCNSLKQCIESANDILVTKIHEKHLEYNYYIDENVPEYIKTDSGRLKQVLLNILNNSIKFTDKGKITLNISAKEINIGEYELLFTINDTGRGISIHDRSKLFKSFSRIENNNFKINEGTGLGLSISKQLVNLMDGDIWIEWSELNCGSTFCFSIKTKECKNKVLLENTIYTNFNNCKVFILDDKYENRIHLAKMVKNWGMIPTVFSSPKEALFMLKQHDFDYQLGLIDTCMPEMNGKEFSKKLKQLLIDEKRDNIPLIVLSSLGDSKDYKDSKDFYAHLIKPIKESRLKQICNELRNITSKIIPENTNKINCINYTFNIKDEIKILLAEDVLINQKVVVNFLNKLGYNNIDVVENGKICLEYLTKNKYNIVLLDIRMPILSGDNVFKYIYNYYNIKEQIDKEQLGKENNTNNEDNNNYSYISLDKYNFNMEYKLLSTSKPYIVAITAYSLKEDREKYMKMGFDDYIPKPINLNVLEDCMNNYLKKIVYL